MRGPVGLGNLTVRGMTDRGPIDGRDPAVFFFREGHDTLDERLCTFLAVCTFIRAAAQ